jgi:hypothetical protein
MDAPGRDGIVQTKEDQPSARLDGPAQRSSADAPSRPVDLPDFFERRRS